LGVGGLNRGISQVGHRSVVCHSFAVCRTGPEIAVPGGRATYSNSGQAVEGLGSLGSALTAIFQCSMASVVFPMRSRFCPKYVRPRCWVKRDDLFAIVLSPL